MSALNIAVPVMMGAISLGVYGTFDYMTRAQAAPEGLTFSQYVSDLSGRVATTAKDSAPKRTELADHMPAAPSGWARRAYQQSDYQTVTGIVPRELTELEQEMADSVSEMEKNPMFKLMAATQARGFDGEKATYLRGRRMVLVSFQFTPARVTNGIGGAQMAMMMNMNEMQDNWDTEPFAVVDGLEFRIKDVKKSDEAREIRAKIGTQTTIQIVTNANDEQVMAILQEIDVAGLNARMAEPDPNIGEDFETGLLANAVAGAPTISDGSVTINAAQMKTLARQLRPLLDPQTARDTHLLSLIEVGAVTNKRTAQDHVGSLDEVHPSVIALLEGRYLPPTAQTTAEADAQVPVIRRGTKVHQGQSLGGDCGLELGARRCVVADDG